MKGATKKDGGRLIRYLIRILIRTVLIGTCLTMTTASTAEERTKTEQAAPIYVTASMLNGRAKPSKRAKIEARFDQGDALTPTGRLSKDLEWVEVQGGESGTVWVHIKYVTERIGTFTVINENHGRVAIWSKKGGGRRKGYTRKGETLTIDRVLMGWGHCQKGWVDLEYFIEEV